MRSKHSILVFLAAIGFYFGFGKAYSQSASCPYSNDKCQQESISSRKACLETLRHRLNTCITNAATAKGGLDDAIYDKLKKKIEAANAVVDKRNVNIDSDALIVSRTLAIYQQYFTVVTANYQNLMNDFVNSYKASAEAVKEQIELEYAKASSENRRVLVDAIANLDRIRSAESQMAFRQRSQASLTTRNAEDLGDRLKSRLSGQIKYIESNGLGQILEPFSDMQPSIANVLHYVDERQQLFIPKIANAQTVLQARLDAVRKIEVEREISPTLKESVYLTSVAKFMSEVDTARAKAFQEGESTTKLNLPLYGVQYASLRSFLDYDQICSGTSKPKWTESGCLRFKQYRAQASRLYGSVLGTYIRQNLDYLQSKFPDVETKKIDHVRGLIANKQYAEAIEIYDLILKADGLK